MYVYFQIKCILIQADLGDIACWVRDHGNKATCNCLLVGGSCLQFVKSTTPVKHNGARSACINNTFRNVACRSEALYPQASFLRRFGERVVYGDSLLWKEGFYQCNYFGEKHTLRYIRGLVQSCQELPAWTGHASGPHEGNNAGKAPCRQAHLHPWVHPVHGSMNAVLLRAPWGLSQLSVLWGPEVCVPPRKPASAEMSPHEQRHWAHSTCHSQRRYSVHGTQRPIVCQRSVLTYRCGYDDSAPV